MLYTLYLGDGDEEGLALLGSAAHAFEAMRLEAEVRGEAGAEKDLKEQAESNLIYPRVEVCKLHSKLLR